MNRVSLNSLLRRNNVQRDPDPVNVRLTDASVADFGFRFQEEQSLDSETIHGGEQFGFFALSTISSFSRMAGGTNGDQSRGEIGVNQRMTGGLGDVAQLLANDWRATGQEIAGRLDPSTFRQ